jgi:hypothetical protein
MRHENFGFTLPTLQKRYLLAQNRPISSIHNGKQGDHINTYGFYPLNEKNGEMEHGGRGRHSKLTTSYITFEHGSYS